GFHAWLASGPGAASPDFLRQIANQVIPRSRTPGAGEVPEVLAFVNRAMPAGLYGGSETTLGALERALDGMVASSRFVKATSADQVKVLTAIDKDAFAHRAEAGQEAAVHALWRCVKEAIVVGYYTSETGGAHELAYELVPGRFDPDVPLGSVPYLSNYWLENVF
ncbi:MAG TPA: gluconate 2-dehydrogenase subunit 3 family protein, partial [Novosphingobium sp.]|nr:gluconate 2-dehydrogenase subunit 3 family protein [Novosphingobium sp.]